MKYGWACTTPDGTRVELTNIIDSDPPLVELSVMEPDQVLGQEPHTVLGVAEARIPEDKLQAMARHILGLQPYQRDAKEGSQDDEQPDWRRYEPGEGRSPV